jgi:hypothetical protein
MHRKDTMMGPESEAFVVLPALDDYDGGNCLCYVRKATVQEQEKVRPEMRDEYYVGVIGTENFDMTYLSARIPLVQEIKRRPIDGFIMGHCSRLHLISQDEWDRIKQAYLGLTTRVDETGDIREASPEIAMLQRHYGTAAAAWDAGDERAWALLHQAESME